jgi:lysozyme family protein
MSFKRAIARVLGHEDRYSDDPADPGNWTGGRVGAGQLKGTKWGISAAAYPHLDIRNLSREDAIAIYKRDYWDRCRCDEWPEPVGEAVFDMAVNQGQGTAIRCLQRAAGVTADGIVGPKTRAAVKQADPDDLLLDFFAWHAIDYAEIARENPANWEEHNLGWMRRLLREFSVALGG